MAKSLESPTAGDLKTNRAGHLIRHTDGANRLTSFTRDELGRLLQKQSSDGELSLFSYDPMGRLQQAVNNHAELKFQYDALGRLTEEQQNGQRIRHHYNAVGHKVKTELPNGDHIDYQYNNLGLFTQVAFNGQTVTDIQRNTLGQEIQRTSGAIASENEYDPMGRLIRQRAAKDQSALIDRRYRYNKAGNLQQIDDFKQGTTKFHYDALDRLKAVEGLTPERFSFDPAGNLLDAETPASGGYVKGNRLHVFQDYRFEYDDVGNLVTEKKGKRETRFTYNAQNQLIKVEKEGQTFQYAYDPFGRRISKKDAFGETKFLWNGDVILAEQRQNINITYLHEPGSFVPLAQVKDGQLYHYHNDHLGTPQLVTDQQGDVVWEARYKVYGNVVTYEVEAVENNIRFQGQYFDAETGLHYNRNRYYHPVVGRFITVDPIGLLGGTNNYEYAPNPVGWVDPFGLSCKEITAQNIVEDDKGLNPHGQAIPDNYDVLADKYKAAILVLETNDAVIRRSTNILVNKRGIPVITKQNINDLKNVDLLIVNGHGSGSVIANMSGTELGNLINSAGITPKAIDVIACCRTPGPARQDLADVVGVPVRGTKGRTAIDDHGKQWIWNEEKTAANGDPNKKENFEFYPPGDGYDIFHPNS